MPDATVRRISCKTHGGMGGPSLSIRRLTVWVPRIGLRPLIGTQNRRRQSAGAPLDFDGLIRKGNRVLDRILRARRRKRPKVFEVDFLPFHFRNFAQPLAGQDQKFDEPGIDRLKRVRGLPDGFQLVIG